MAKDAKKKGKAATIRKIDGKSLSPQKELAELFKSRFPEILAEGKVDPDKLKQALGQEIDTNHERYGLSWAGKSECFRHIQETTAATLKPMRGESVDFDATENIFIEGDNLEVLKILQKTYQNKIKMIYIDPPYNTGNDSFIYPDRFKEERNGYEERAGIRDEEGLLTKDGFWRKNSKDAGHFHSNWLSMMYPRLFLAKNLLREDGVIFVSIDDNEVQNLRMIMDEVFGEENFVTALIWKRRQNVDSRHKKGISVDHEYTLVYSRGEAGCLRGGEKDLSKYSNPDNDPRGPWASDNLVGLATKDQRPNLHYDLVNPETGISYPCAEAGWRYSKSTMQKLIKQGKILWPAKPDGRPRLKRFLNELESEFTGLSSILDAAYNTQATLELKALFDGRDVLDFPKPKDYLKLLVQQGSKDSDEQGIVLDFFAGSCTTADAVMALNAEDGGNRKFICVQLAEPCEQESEAFKAGFKTIADIGKERIRRAGKKIKGENKGKLDFDGGKLDLGFKVFRLEESNFKQWRTDIKTGAELKKQLQLFVDNVAQGAKPEDMLFEIILKNSRFDLNVATEKRNYDGVEYYVLATEHSEGTEKEKVNHRLTQINPDFEIVCLADRITKKFVDKVLATKPERFTCLDVAFKNNDQLKTNTALQMEAAKIEFKVI